MQAEMLTYSRSRGLFAGVSLEGSTLRSDDDANESVYGKKVSARDIVRGTLDVPRDAKTLVDLLNRKSPKNLSERTQ
jgi:lipid-binding SYLF domain-containing protein